MNSTMQNRDDQNSTSMSSLELSEPLADLKTQVQQWLRFEQQQYGTSRVSEVERNGTIFTIWLSLWDLWYYAEKEHSNAEWAVTKTMDILFDQLDIIAENWPSEMKIIMPEAIDLSFLPAWHNTRIGRSGTDQKGDILRNSIALVEQWNNALDTRAAGWQRGSMYIYNTNEWLLDQVREQQLLDARVSDANGMGSNQTPWDNVHSGCLESSKDHIDLAKAAHCSDPDKYLFW